MYCNVLVKRNLTKDWPGADKKRELTDGREKEKPTW